VWLTSANVYLLNPRGLATLKKKNPRGLAEGDKSNDSEMSPTSDDVFDAFIFFGVRPLSYTMWDHFHHFLNFNFLYYHCSILSPLRKHFTIMLPTLTSLSRGVSVNLVGGTEAGAHRRRAAAQNAGRWARGQRRRIRTRTSLMTESTHFQP
jgi:hypothetical protein